MTGETELQMVVRHVRQGEVHVRRQRDIVAKLTAAGRVLTTAQTLLASFEAIQIEHIAHLARIIERDRTLS